MQKEKPLVRQISEFVEKERKIKNSGGKHIGAVTYVLVNDPTRGYGIFIENMLKTDRSEILKFP